MRGDIRCIDGTRYRHDPQPDDPNLETDDSPDFSVEDARFAPPEYCYGRPDLPVCHTCQQILPIGHRGDTCIMCSGYEGWAE